MIEQLINKPFKEFLTALASKEPVPGGGGAAALNGAIAAALVSMVANLTVGKAKYAPVECKIRPILVSAEMLRTRMLALVAADAAVFAKFMDCYKMPKNTEEEQARRKENIQIAAYDATEVPLQIVNSCIELLMLANQIVRIGNTTAITDATTAAFFARAALRGACYSVQSNLLLISDQEYVTKTEVYLMKINQQALKLEEEIVQATDVAMG
ncbi:MAG: cyclodeaminase/cyclohydrolase family protein [Acidaminococcaceae bacterium]